MVALCSVASAQTSSTAAAPAASRETSAKRSDPGTARPDDSPQSEVAAEIQAVPSRWRSYDWQGRPEYSFRIYDPYHQNILKADFPLAGNWFLELNALNTFVYKSRRNLDFSSVFADQIAAGTLVFVRHNQFVAENVLFGAEVRRFDDAFVPSDFRFRINGVADFKHDITAFNSGSNGDAHLVDAFVDLRLADFGGSNDGHDNFDLLFLRGGLQAFRSDFHGLLFNDAGLGGRLFGELKRNRLRYDFAWLKLFQKDAVTGFIDFARPSSHQVAIARVTWEDLVPGWNSEWTFHYNRERRKVSGAAFRANTDTYYLGAAFNGHLGRLTFNPAAYFVFGTADQVVAEPVPAKTEHDVAAWMVLLDAQYKLDFWNIRAGYLFASGDGNPADTKDRGFDAISDGLTLFGGPLSYWVGENIKFGRGDFVRANSLLPSLRGVNDPAHHIHPGLHAFNAGVDLALSPRMELSVNVNLLRFAATGSYTNRIVIGHHGAAVEENVFFRLKPFLREANQNVIFDLGFSLLHPLQGLKDAFQRGGAVYSTFLALRLVY